MVIAGAQTWYIEFEQSPIMANKSPRYSLQYKKDQAGCIWGFINIFDFRNGRSTRKLLADGRQASGQVGEKSLKKALSSINSLVFKINSF